MTQCDLDLLNSWLQAKFKGHRIHFQSSNYSQNYTPNKIQCVAIQCWNLSTSKHR